MFKNVQTQDEFQSLVEQFVKNRQQLKQNIQEENTGIVHTQMQEAIRQKPTVDKLENIEKKLTESNTQLQKISDNNETAVVVRDKEKPLPKKSQAQNAYNVWQSAIGMKGKHRPETSFEVNRHGGLGNKGKVKISELHRNRLVVTNSAGATKVVPLNTQGKQVLFLLNSDQLTQFDESITQSDIEVYRDVMTFVGYVPQAYSGSTKANRFIKHISVAKPRSNTKPKRKPKNKSPTTPPAKLIYEREDGLFQDRAGNIYDKEGNAIGGQGESKVGDSPMDRDVGNLALLDQSIGEGLKRKKAKKVNSTDAKVHRLDVLCNSKIAGNCSKQLDNELTDILDDLLKGKVIDKKTHSTLWKKYVG